MGMFMNKKLVRDKIPDIVIREGKVPYYYEATEEEYEKYLYEKLIEESREIGVSNGDIEEIADLLEVIMAIIELKGYERIQVDVERAIKAHHKGKFAKRYILEGIED